MNFVYKLFRQDPESREGVIATTSGVGIIANVFIALTKVVLGLFTSSIAIISEGVNNATDALSSVITLVGSRLAGKHPDENHPFGYGRIEYLTSLVIATIILVGGVEMLISSIKLIFDPAELSISYVSLIIVAITAVVKFFLGIYTIKMGEKVDSSALVAVGLEGKNDSFASIITIISAAIFLLFDYSVDAFAGIITSGLIIKAGVDVLLNTINDLLGRPGEKELASSLYKQIRQTDGVLNAADMMLHNYGPDKWSGSVNIEIDHNKTVGEVYKVIHDLQLRIMHELNVTMVFGIYAVDNDHEDIKVIRKVVGEFVKSYEHVKSFHAVYVDSTIRKIYCDLIVDYRLMDWEGLKSSFLEYMAGKFPANEVELTIETEFV